jgi:hypothetical protein
LLNFSSAVTRIPDQALLVAGVNIDDLRTQFAAHSETGMINRMGSTITRISERQDICCHDCAISLPSSVVVFLGAGKISMGEFDGAQRALYSRPLQ